MVGAAAGPASGPEGVEDSHPRFGRARAFAKAPVPGGGPSGAEPRAAGCEAWAWRALPASARSSGPSELWGRVCPAAPGGLRARFWQLDGRAMSRGLSAMGTAHSGSAPASPAVRPIAPSRPASSWPAETNAPPCRCSPPGRFRPGAQEPAPLAWPSAVWLGVAAAFDPPGRTRGPRLLDGPACLGRALSFGNGGWGSLAGPLLIARTAGSASRLPFELNS